MTDAVGLLGELARLDREGLAADGDFTLVHIGTPRGGYGSRVKRVAQALAGQDAGWRATRVSRRPS